MNTKPAVTIAVEVDCDWCDGTSRCTKCNGYGKIVMLLQPRPSFSDTLLVFGMTLVGVAIVIGALLWRAGALRP